MMVALFKWRFFDGGLQEFYYRSKCRIFQVILKGIPVAEFLVYYEPGLMASYLAKLKCQHARLACRNADITSWLIDLK